MGRADAILSRVNVALNRVGPQDRTVYKRVITQTGGDSLIGRIGATTYVDTLVSPQPTYQRLARFLVGPQSKSEEVLQSGGEAVANQYMVLFSATSVTKADLESDNVVFLFKDGSGKSEVFTVDDYEEAALNGVDIVFITYLKSTKRP